MLTESSVWSCCKLDGAPPPPPSFLDPREQSHTSSHSKCMPFPSGDMPFTYCRGRHIQEDIPKMVEEAAGQHPGITCKIAKPIGTLWIACWVGTCYLC